MHLLLETNAVKTRVCYTLHLIGTVDEEYHEIGELHHKLHRQVTLRVTPQYSQVHVVFHLEYAVRSQLGRTQGTHWRKSVPYMYVRIR